MLMIPTLASGTENWDRFRGPNGAGQGEAEGIPSQWSKGEYLWKQSLPGIGYSSPVVWGDRLFITSADPDSAEQILLAYNAHSGEPLWEQRFASAPHAMHRQNSYATSTPALDAERMYISWKAGDAVWLAAWTHDGDEVWRREVASLDEHHGYGTSPVVVGDVVCLANETSNETNSVVAAFDRATGKPRWRKQRTPGKTSYATPIVWQNAAGDDLILTASMGAGLTAFDPASGEIAWQVLQSDLPDRCVSSPMVAAGLIFVSCGSGNNGLHLIAVRPGENGDAPQEAYRLRQGIPNIPTPVAVDDLLIVWHDRGTVACIDAATGDEHWRERIGGYFHSSPLRVGERIFCLSMDGDVIVLAADSEYKLLGRTSLDEPCQATPAVAHGRLFIRTDQSLICVGPREL